MVFLFAAIPFMCQSGPQATRLSLKILTRQRTVLAGEPIFFSATVTNEGPVTAIVKVNSGDVMGPWLYMPCCKEALVIKGADGQVRYSSFGVLYAALKPGDTKLTPYANPGGLMIRKAGHYDIWAELQSTGVSAYPTVSPNPPRYEYFWKGHAISNVCSIDVLTPTSIDAQAYQAFKGHPLKHTAELLKRFPTSTYAGYALLSEGPGFTMWDLVNLSDSNRDQHLTIPQGVSIEKQDELRTKYLASYQSFLDKAEKFLTVHPDFARRDLLRKEMANALFLLGRQEEALSQVKLIEAKEGPLAEEAKKTLQKAGVVKPSCKTKNKK